MTLCESCVHGEICNIRGCRDVYDEKALKYCANYKDNSAKVADVVEVVRCKECAYGRIQTCAITGTETLLCEYWIKSDAVDPMHYCSYGKRKENEDD